MGSVGFLLLLVVFFLTFSTLSPYFQGPRKPFSHTFTPSKNTPFEVEYLQTTFPKVAHQVANLSEIVSRANPAEFVLDATAKQAESAIHMLKRTSENLEIFGEKSQGKAQKLLKELKGQYKNAIEHANQTKEDFAWFRFLSTDLNKALLENLDYITYELATAANFLTNASSIPEDELQTFSSNLIKRLKNIGPERKTRVDRNKDSWQILQSLDTLDDDIKKIAQTKFKLGNEAKQYLLAKRKAYDEYKESCNLAGYFCSQDPVPKLEDFENWLLCGLTADDDCPVTSKDLTRARQSLRQLLNKAKDEFLKINTQINKVDFRRKEYPGSRS